MFHYHASLRISPLLLTQICAPCGRGASLSLSRGNDTLNKSLMVKRFLSESPNDRNLIIFPLTLTSINAMIEANLRRHRRHRRLLRRLRRLLAIVVVVRDVRVTILVVILLVVVNVAVKM